jgi:hypothetical protein
MRQSPVPQVPGQEPLRPTEVCRTPMAKARDEASTRIMDMRGWLGQIDDILVHAQCVFHRMPACLQHARETRVDGGDDGVRAATRYHAP